MTATIIEFPPVFVIEEASEGEQEDRCGPQTCDRCVHFMSGYLGQFCRSYMEDIFNLHEAENCNFYEEI